MGTNPDRNNRFQIGVDRTDDHWLLVAPKPIR